jgi:hemerythrin
MWSVDYEIIPSIDEQHQQIFALMSALVDAIERGDASAAIRQTLSGLVDYGLSHFKYEEALLKHTNYPDFALHAQHHRELLREVEAQFPVEGEDTDAISLLRFLESWLRYHILIEDMAFKDHLVSNNIK